MAILTKDMIGWCYALDVVTWLSDDATNRGDYLAVEVIALSNAGEVLVVSDDEYEASVIYCAMMHLPSLTSVMNDWDRVTWKEETLAFICKEQYIEYATCKYNPCIDGKQNKWTREYLENIWKRMRK